MLKSMLKHVLRPTLCSLAVLGAVAASPVAYGAPATIDPGVFTQLAASPETPVWVYLKEKADLSGAVRLHTKLEKNRFVYEALKANADRTQAPIRAELTRRGVSFQSHFLVNALLVHADKALIQELARRPEVRRIAPNPRLHMLHTPVAREDGDDVANGVEWNVETVNAPEVWDAGYKGAGVVIAGNDTGVDWTHPAITRQYRGTTPGDPDHNYNWFDAIANKPVPYDDHGHGTFTVGEVVGDDGNGNQIGVAPEARWMACKNMDAGGNGTPASYISCFEWFIAPTDSAGKNADPAMAPDVINNSWSCPDSEGCEPETLHDIANAVQSAGIMLVFSAGNSGPSCSTVNEPVAMYPEVLSVGATDSANAIASFSSRGPSAYDFSPKPNVSAPGVSVRSCVPNGGYTSMSGTSMAAPMVTGTVALLWSADPSRIGDIAGTSALLEDSAVFRAAPRCGVSRAQGSNNVYGNGIIDARAALDELLSSP